MREEREIQHVENAIGRSQAVAPVVENIQLELDIYITQSAM